MRRLVATLVAIFVIAVLAQEAAGQCEMTKTAATSGMWLCGVGGTDWRWSGPAGFSATSQCVAAPAAGTYTLRVWDGMNGLWSAPCTYAVTGSEQGPMGAITGADSVCAGSIATWCAPAGNLGYAWSGPFGFSGSTACVDVSEAGAYTLTLTDLTTGISGAPSTRTLVARDCSAPRRQSGCPAPARWWTLSCDGRAGGLDAALYAQVAIAVDQRSAALNFGGRAEGLCSLLRHGHHLEGVRAARRQYAAVLANMVAADLGVTTSDGRGVGLDPAMPLDGIRDVPAGRTLGDWVANTESALASMGNAARSRTAREACRRIERQGRSINRGQGNAGCAAVAVTMSLDPEDDDDVITSGSGTASVQGVVSMSRLAADPLSSAQGLRLTLVRAEWVEVQVMDITGRRVRHLASGVFAMGTHDLTWDGHDDDGRALRSGAYFVAGRIGAERLSQRLMIVR
jgi:hypothetical protein